MPPRLNREGRFRTSEPTYFCSQTGCLWRSMLGSVSKSVSVQTSSDSSDMQKYSDSWFQHNTPRRVVLIFVL